MRRFTRQPRSDLGLTLIEVLITVAIMGIAFVSILGAMGTSILASDIHRKRANAETVLRNYSEAIKGTSYVPCPASGTAYNNASGFTPASPNQNYSVSVTAVEYLATSTVSGNVVPSPIPCATPTSDPGVQRLTLQVSGPSGATHQVTQTVKVIRRAP
ncbi:MAG: prepilin-type N-terminal cleavage/methylation domain-containing protein [Actinomycetota bacterium]|nr:type II secretion system GspH family protein [Actinomycetota bacterium]